MPRVYDLFLVFNELDVVDIRLHELANVVTIFGMVEATKTFTGHPRALVFDTYAERWPEFADRIRYLSIDLPTAGAWIREEVQRTALGMLLTDARPEDLILVSDADEIPRADAVRRALLLQEKVKFDQVMSQFYWNHICVDEPWRGTAGVRYRDWTNAQAARMQIDMTVIADGGWHASYLGGIDAVQQKIRSYSHAPEFDIPGINDAGLITARIQAGEDVFLRGAGLRYRVDPLDASYPAYLLTNQDRFRHLIEPLPVGPALPERR